MHVDTTPITVLTKQFNVDYESDCEYNRGQIVRKSKKFVEKFLNYKTNIIKYENEIVIVNVPWRARELKYACNPTTKQIFKIENDNDYIELISGEEDAGSINFASLVFSIAVGKIENELNPIE